jgi:hypothetical protein
MVINAAFAQFLENDFATFPGTIAKTQSQGTQNPNS